MVAFYPPRPLPSILIFKITLEDFKNLILGQCKTNMAESLGPKVSAIRKQSLGSRKISLVTNKLAGVPHRQSPNAHRQSVNVLKLLAQDMN